MSLGWKKTLGAMAVLAGTFYSGFTIGTMSVPNYIVPPHSTSTAYTFTPPAPANLQDLSQSSGQIKLSWSPVPGAVEYQIDYRVSGQNIWHYTDVHMSTSATINTPYLGSNTYIVVRDFFRIGGKLVPSAWSAPITARPYVQWPIIKMMAYASVVKVWDYSVNSGIYIGTGFIVPAGYIVTCNHVIDHGGTIKIQFAGRNSHVAEVVSTSTRDDLALLYASQANLSFYASHGGAQFPARVGQPVAFAGYPLGGGFNFQASQSILSMGKTINATGAGMLTNMMDVWGHNVPGFSGGPMFNAHGQVVGVMQSTELSPQQYYTTDKADAWVIPFYKLQRFLGRSIPQTDQAALVKDGY